MKPWWSQLWRHLPPYRSALGLILVLLMVDVIFNVLIPWPLKLIVDHVLVGEPLPDEVGWISILPGVSSNLGVLAWLAFSGLLLFVLRQVALVSRAYVQMGVGTQMKLDVAGNVFSHLQRLSLRFHGTYKTGDLVQRVTRDSSFIRLLLGSVLLPAVVSVSTVLFMFWVMWEIDRTLSLVTIATALPLPILMRRLTPRMSERFYDQYQAEGELMALTEQTMTSLPLVQAFGREAQEDRRFRGMSSRVIDAYLQSVRSQLQYGIGVGIATAVGTSTVLIVGGMHAYDGTLSMGSLLVFLAYLKAIYDPLETLANLSTSYADGVGQARRILDVLGSEDFVSVRKEALPLPKATVGSPTVILDNVTFGFRPGEPVLNGINLVLNAGETVALVGTTGTGKSTLASLIPRFFDPWQGRVLINGRDARDFELQSLRALIALVLQEPFLLPLTVAENIAYGRPWAERDAIVAAAVAANADDFIRQLPEGYDTVIGERGATLSGGQRQRLAIARALLKDAPILILDEPTSALDARTEELLLEAMQRLAVNRTTLIIAHRPATIKSADRVYELSQGRLSVFNEPCHQSHVK